MRAVADAQPRARGGSYRGLAEAPTAEARINRREGRMTVGGGGIPRLQELAYIETVASSVAHGETFEEIRLKVVDHSWAAKVQAPGDPPDPADYARWRADEKKFVRNVTDAL